MNRFLTQIAVAGLATALLVPQGALAAKKQKHKKNVDLSANPLGNVNTKQPDKELFDKAMVALKKGRFDVARLDLQTLLNTYPESEYQMRAKLAVGDTWFKEGGSAALTQAEAEYKDFETFFPNVPEAAEAQMKVADIYYVQMEKPDRDFQNVARADQEYRAMIQQYPESPLIPRAKQKLREVQEVLAEREFTIGSFYGSRENWGASIARLQTIENNYPLYSKSDQVLLGLGDAYAAQARMTRQMNLPPASKEKLEQAFLEQATAAYSKVITRYPNAPHVEDARDRLVALNRPVPEPTPEALAQNEAEEKSRTQIKLSNRAALLFKHGPSTIESTRVGEPTMEAPKRTTAPDINKRTEALVNTALGIHPAAEGTPAPANTAAAPNTVPPRTESPAVKLEDVPGDSGGSTGLGVSIVGAPATATSPDAAPAASNGLNGVGPKSTDLPPVEKPETAPAQTNDVQPGSIPAPAPTAQGEKPKKPGYDSSDESSSKHKKKKGIKKVNPF